MENSFSSYAFYKTGLTILFSLASKVLWSDLTDIFLVWIYVTLRRTQGLVLALHMGIIIPGGFEKLCGHIEEKESFVESPCNFHQS